MTGPRSRRKNRSGIAQRERERAGRERQRSASMTVGLAAIVSAALALAAAPSPALAQAAPPSNGTERLMEQLRGFGLAPEQEGMDAQGLVDDGGPNRGLMDLYRQQREAREAARQAADDPGETVLDLPPELIPEVRGEMRLLIQELARYARARDPGFTILARGASPLAFRSWREAKLEAVLAAGSGGGSVDPDSPAAGVGEPASGFLNAVDGLVFDGQFCGDPPVTDEDLARMASLNLVRISIDHCADADVAVEAQRRAALAGVLLHVDTDPEGRLDTIPRGHPWGENAANITDPHQARSVLVLEEGAGFGDASLLIGALNQTNHDLLILNPFALGGRAFGKQDVEALRYKRLGARRMVLATFDVGMAQETAYYWKPGWTLGNPRWLQATALERPGSYFTAFWDPAWKALIGEFFVALMDLGFDGVVVDGIDSVRRWEAITPIRED